MMKWQYCDEKYKILYDENISSWKEKMTSVVWHNWRYLIDAATTVVMRNDYSVKAPVKNSGIKSSRSC